MGDWRESEGEGGGMVERIRDKQAAQDPVVEAVLWEVTERHCGIAESMDINCFQFAFNEMEHDEHEAGCLSESVSCS